MKPCKFGKCRVPLVLLAVLLLIGSGMGLVGRVFEQNENVMVQNQDAQLLGLAQSVDRSVVSYLSRYATDLSYVTGRRGFLDAEETWLATGESEDLLFRMEESLIMQYQMTHAMLAIRDEKIILSTNGSTDYYFPKQAGREGDVSIWPCMDDGGNIYLAFLYQNPSGVVYAAIIDLSFFYGRIAGELDVESQEHIMLLDKTGNTLIHSAHNRMQVDAVETLTEDFTDYAGLQQLLDWQADEGCVSYTTLNCFTGEEYTARMAVLPASAGNNGYFDIAVSTNFDQLIQPLHTAALRLLLYGGMVAAGVLLLMFLVLRSSRQNRLAIQEVAALQEKNAALDALNAKTRELAHHQRLETIGTLTSSIAHEFNNLLTPIMGYSILALEKLPPEETEIYDSLLEIYQSSRKAKDIISRLSDLSRKNTGLTDQYVSPDELARRVLEVAKPARPPQVEVQTELNCRHVWLHGNETQLSQVLLNLVLNAFHAMEKDGGTLTISTAADESHIIFRVKDTGCGISTDVLPHIFDPFFTTKETGKGTGLGLAIVQQVVEGHQGRIKVDTAVGQGTSFTIFFPLHTRQEN